MTIQVNTSNYGGRILKKTVEVFTNDTVRPVVRLKITGRVDALYTIRPNMIRLSGGVGEALKETVTIEPNPKYPFKIKRVVAGNGKDIRFNLEESPGPKGPNYRLTVENLKKEPGRYFDTLTLDTDSHLRPTLSISVQGRITEPPREENQ